MKIKLLLLNLVFFSSVLAQLPDTDIWLFKLKTQKENTIIKSGYNITKRLGYDNQPVFSNDSKKIYFVSDAQPDLFFFDSKQTDISFYDIKTKKNHNITHSKVSEYSPTLTPNKKILACVVVGEDSSQTIVPYEIETMEKTNYPNNKFKNQQISLIDSVGYFTFLNTDTVIYYKLTQPHTLLYYSISTGENKWLGNNPTRGFKALNRHTLVYGLKEDSSVVFYKYDFILQKAEKYAIYNSLNEDIIWHSKWGLMKSEGTKILFFDPIKNDWITLFDLTSYGLKKITRFTFDLKNNYLVVVDNL